MTVPPPPAALRLLGLPGVFTQDGLLGSGAFVRLAERQGDRVTVENLEDLARSGHLVPLYEVVDGADPTLAVDTGPLLGRNPRGWALDAAREGRLRVPSLEPGRRPATHGTPADAPRGTWNGYVYSSWQALGVARARNLAGIARAADVPAGAPGPTPDLLALCVLSPKYLPGVLGTASMPSGSDWDDLWSHRTRDVRDLLAVVDVDPAVLLPAAERLLGAALSDPMRGWWPVLRHAGGRGWARLAGPTRRHAWERIAAEILLRAHEDLAGDGHLDRLPTTAGRLGMLLDGRVGRGRSSDLDADLTSFGLSLHPKVVLLVEGQTEGVHLGRLLSLFGLDRPDVVRLVVNRGSGVNAYLLAKYAATPRLGLRTETAHHLHAPPTALFVVMDPENTQRNARDVDERVGRLRRAVREDVEVQGGTISDDELEHVVRFRTWGTLTYELANFDDEELADAVTTLAEERGVDTTGPAWRTGLLSRLSAARRPRGDVKEVLSAVRVPEAKTRLAEILWPVLREKAEAHPGVADPPVLEILREVRDLAVSLSAGAFALGRPTPDPGTGP